MEGALLEAVGAFKQGRLLPLHAVTGHNDSNGCYGIRHDAVNVATAAQQNDVASHHNNGP